jgi:regulator of sigma E protease
VKVNRVEEGTPAGKAGLQAGDTIVKVEHQPIKHIGEELAIVGANVGRPLNFTVQRDGQMIQLTITPYLDETRNRGVIGFVPELYSPPIISTRLGPLDAIAEGVRFNLHQLMLTKEAFAAILVGDRSVRDTFAGPVGIAVISGEVAQQGMKPLLLMMAILSLSLGIFNLLPIPILDGGQVLMLALEKGFHWFGGELSVALREKIQTVGFTLIILLMGYIIYADIAKLIQ